MVYCKISCQQKQCSLSSCFLFFVLFTVLFIYICGWMVCPHVCLVLTEVRRGHRIPFGLEMVESCHIGARNQIWVLCSPTPFQGY